MVVYAVAPCKSLFLKGSRHLFHLSRDAAGRAMCVWKIAKEQVTSTQKVLKFAQSSFGRATTSIVLQHKLCTDALHPRLKKDVIPSWKISSAIWRVGA